MCIILLLIILVIVIFNTTVTSKNMLVDLAYIDNEFNKQISNEDNRGGGSAAPVQSYKEPPPPQQNSYNDNLIKRVPTLNDKTIDSNAVLFSSYYGKQLKLHNKNNIPENKDIRSWVIDELANGDYWEEHEPFMPRP